MATRKPTRPDSRPRSNRNAASSSGSGVTSFLVGVGVTIVALGAVLFYFGITPARLLRRPNHASPAALGRNADNNPLPAGKASAPPAAPRAGTTVDRTLPDPPFAISEDVFEAGARLYVKPMNVNVTGVNPGAHVSCATCHGTPNRPGAMMESVRPGAEEFFVPGNESKKSPGQLFLRTKYGVPGSTGMPAYASVLSDREIWQMALLLSHAGEPLPNPVTHLLAKR